MAMAASRSERSSDAGCKPICRTHAGTPCPMPAMKRPGKALPRVASSIAMTAGCRATAAATPRPTGTLRVVPSTVATEEMPPSWK